MKFPIKAPVLIQVVTFRCARTLSKESRKVEIIADRGIDAKVGAAGWEKICAEMESNFRAGNFAGGAIKGIQAVSRQLARHFPKHGGGNNELPDTPVVI